MDFDSKNNFFKCTTLMFRKSEGITSANYASLLGCVSNAEATQAELIFYEFVNIKGFDFYPKKVYLTVGWILTQFFHYTKKQFEDRKYWKAD